MAIRRSQRRVSQARIGALARELLEASTLCAISTVGPRGRAYVNTAYFAWAPDLRIIWLSDPGARHSRNLRTNPSVAIAVYDSGQTWGKPDRGIQVFGDARAGGPDAEEIYAPRFRAYEPQKAYRFYELVPTRVKLFDERALGAATFVTAKVARGGKLAWERTDAYRAGR
ncbi:MAG: pyridoxamine 5'-phosphate oxidase family protein [Actinobacteria bacterium]|nr:MAG: pyridoxamine 5'-phosphate oxidase family protein [Actinomycetota bacterium]